MAKGVTLQLLFYIALCFHISQQRKQYCRLCEGVSSLAECSDYGVLCDNSVGQVMCFLQVHNGTHGVEIYSGCASLTECGHVHQRSVRQTHPDPKVGAGQGRSLCGNCCSGNYDCVDRFCIYEIANGVRNPNAVQHISPHRNAGFLMGHSISHVGGGSAGQLSGPVFPDPFLISTRTCAILNGDSSIAFFKHNGLVECSGTDICYLQVVDNAGTTEIYGGCTPTGACPGAAFASDKHKALTNPKPYLPDRVGTVTCGQCCDQRDNTIGNNCNLNLCAGIASGHIFGSGMKNPIVNPHPGTKQRCAICDHADSLSECTGFRTCSQETDYCYMQQITIQPGVTKFYADCSTLKLCASMSNKGTASAMLKRPECVVGGRNCMTYVTDTSSLQVCGECCSSGNMCNLDLCKAAGQNVQSPKPTTKLIPTTTTTTTTPLPTTPTTTVTTTVGQPIICEVCSGGLCGVIPGNDPVKVCPSGHFCMNTVDNDANGNKVITKRCATVGECENKWWHLSSSNPECASLDLKARYNFRLSCSFCCTVSGCNRDVIPATKMLF